jgi:hypothetical protein
MSSSDKDALNAFLPEYLKAESMSSLILKAATQIGTLKELAVDLLKELDMAHAERVGGRLTSRTRFFLPGKVTSRR